MDVMGTVNFEDLFDFSPEPFDRESNDYAEEEVQHQQQQHQQPPTVAAIQPKIVYEKGEQTPSPGPFIVEKHSHPTSKLSASLPATWTTNLSTSYTGSSSPGGSSGGFGGRGGGAGLDGSGESFGQHVEDYSPEVQQPIAKGKRGRKPGQKSAKSEMKNRLERSRQSARECRARKKLRYQYLDDLILEREKANIVLRQELLKCQVWCHELDKGKIPDDFKEFLRQMKSQSTNDFNHNV